MSKGEKNNKENIYSENNKEELINKNSKNIKCSKKITESNNIKDNIKNIKNSNENKDEDNKFWKNKLINSLVKFILNIILGFFIYLVVGVEFGFFNSIYCQPTDGESNNNVDSNKDNKIASENKDVKGKGKEADS